MLSAIILAAGSSVRMGDANKLLLPFKNKTVVEIVVENIIAAGIDEVIVVLGYQATQVKNVLQHLPVCFVSNADYKKGITTSIQYGVSIATGNGYMICLADMVKISSAEYKSLRDFFENKYLLNHSCICIPVFNSQKGNPVIFSSSYKEAILQCAYMDGCKKIVEENKENLFLPEMSTNNVLTDIDSKDDYENLFL
jgi:molybdenum cofactor cytidylyltransferase